MEAAGSGSSSEREPLAGLVERVTFHSAVSGFCVLRIKARGHRDLVTVLEWAPHGQYASSRPTGPMPSRWSAKILIGWPATSRALVSNRRILSPSGSVSRERRWSGQGQGLPILWRGNGEWPLW